MKAHLYLATVFIAFHVLISGCSFSASQPLYRSQQDKAPMTTDETLERLARLPDPEVTNEPRSRGGNGPVYTVLGKRYRVMDSSKGFVQEGMASWYGTKFHGRKTSNGERFDIYRLTAAHPHLPLPVYVRVTNLANGRMTVVRVNDRGPFYGDRIIDLSYAAAVKLGFHKDGTTRVRIEVLEPSTKRPASRPGPSAYLVQAGKHTKLQSADQTRFLITKLTGFKGTVVRTPDDGLYRVQVGPVPAGAAMDRLQSVLLAADYGNPRLIPLR
jgi:rare lipoprotein A